MIHELINSIIWLWLSLS